MTRSLKQHIFLLKISKSFQYPHLIYTSILFPLKNSITSSPKQQTKINQRDKNPFKIIENSTNMKKTTGKEIKSSSQIPDVE